MDGKGSRGLSSGNDRQRQLQVLKIGKQCAKFLATHKQALFAGILLAGLVVLLFGDFRQFQGPSNSTAPSGMTAVDYSTFIALVKAGNVLAVFTLGESRLLNLLLSPIKILVFVNPQR